MQYKRNYRPPSEASHVTFSMWADQNQDRAFGGKLEWAKSPFMSQFKELRSVLHLGFRVSWASARVGISRREGGN